MLKVVGASWMQIRMSTWIIGVVLVLGIVVIILGQMGQTEEDGNYSATVYWDTESGFEIKFWGQGMNVDQIPKGAARIYFQPQTETTGWAIVDILTQSNYPDWVQAYAAGMLEGSLSWQLIYYQWKNTVKTTCENRRHFCQYVREYLEANLKSIKRNYQNRDDPYWYQIYLFYVQLEGLQQGFEHGVKRSRQTIEPLNFNDFLWMNAVSDIADLEYKFLSRKPFSVSYNFSQENSFHSESRFLSKIKRSVDLHSTKSQSINDEMLPLLRCGISLGSALIKVLPEKGQMIVAHNSAGPYASMLKMLKHYHFKYHWSATDFWIVDNKLSFSSYPGAIHSMDDFYIVSMANLYTDLIVTSTPLRIFEKSLWKFTHPYNGVLSGPRAIAASRLSKNPSAWAENFSKYNSGTGNKQWMIIDAEIFNNMSKPNSEDKQKYMKELQNTKNILVVAEQIPGHFVAQDQTHVLFEKSYWSSYGLPFYENISDLTGVEKIQEIYGDAFSYESSPIAKIYRRDHRNVTSLTTAMELMRSNSYRTDPLSLGDPKCAIGARGDITVKNLYSFPIGVTDSKVFSMGEPLDRNGTNSTGSATVYLNGDQQFQIIAGPAYPLTISDPENEADYNDKDSIKPFNWATSVFVDFPHEGHPDNWEFHPLNIT